MMAKNDLPRGPGTYCLVLHVAAPARVTVGRLGAFDLPAGWYLYVGSALGGLRGRLQRHLRTEKRRHWHVDYLLCPAEQSAPDGAARVAGLWWAESAERLECVWAQAALAWPGGSVPIPGFGSSDCRCAAHLIGVARPEELVVLRRMMTG